METTFISQFLQPTLLWMAAKVLLVFGGVMTLAALLTWAERRGSAMIQDRIGPNRALLLGRFRLLGLPQVAADGIKFFLKEEVIPARADRVLIWLGPWLTYVVAMLGMAVFPLGKSLDWKGVTYHLSILDPGNGMGLLYWLAVGGLGVYGILISAWAGNNKWGILGGMRASAQMVSYELSMGLAVLAVLMASASVDPHQIVAEQGHWRWFFWRQPLGFLVFLVAVFAETNRLPFDFAEGESEIVAGFHTEMGSMKFGLMGLSEYAHLVTAASAISTLYFGGWQVPFLPSIHAPVLLTLLSFLVKVLFFSWLFIWVRWTLPRFRYDQLMGLGWKFLFPLALGNLVLQAFLASRS